MEKYMKRLFAVILCTSAMIACSPTPKTVDTATNDQVSTDKTVDKAVNAPAEAADLPADLKATEKVLEATEPYCTFTFRYPAFGIDAIDKSIEQYAKEAFEQSKQSIAELYGDQVPNEELAKYYHSMEYEIVRIGADGLDILYTHDGYTGGAHGFFYYDTQMIDKSGKVLTVADIYDDVTAGLKHLSEESRRLLPQQIDNAEGIEDWIESGTEPDLEHFNNVLRTDTGIRVYFSPYQVAPWADGPQWVEFEK